MERSRPKVFVSYSSDDARHEEWVRALGGLLQGQGFVVTLDSWTAGPGVGRPSFLGAAVREHDFVVVVCTPKYKLRADTQEIHEGYERWLMRTEAELGEGGKLIPILRKGRWGKAAPAWLLGMRYVDLTEGAREENCDKLLSLMARAKR